MNLKTIQWNIGGGKIRNKESDPVDPSSYCIDDLEYIAELIKKHDPDIVTLQEIHCGGKENQAELLSKMTGIDYFVIDTYAESHLEEGQGLSQAILSKFKITDHNFSLYTNPQLKLVQPDGEIWISHDKGVTTIILNLEINTKLEVKTTHLVPFRKFGVDPLACDFSSIIKSDINNKLFPKDENFLIQGDFNVDNSGLKEFLPKVFSAGTNEIPVLEPTTPKGRKYDHVIYKGLELKSSKILSNTLTDHFPIISDFEL